MDTFVYRLRGVPRSRTGLACWICALRVRDALREVSGVTEASVHPDNAIASVKVERGQLGDRADLVVAIKRALPGVEPEPLDALPPLSSRVRLTKEVPEPVREALAQASPERPLVVVRCTAKTCACVPVEPERWGAEVVRAEVDLDALPSAKVWLAPEAAPEWICLDRRGNELARWRGRIEPADFERRLAQLVDRAR